ncbi:MAG: DUF86 domain-containing protein [bacterium]|nr:DUF86 domain-containing protein [bacterium]
MSERPDSQLLADIRKAANRAVKYVAGLAYGTFLADTLIQDAVIRNVEIIGEAAKKLSSSARARYPDIPWKQMAGSRDRLIHDTSESTSTSSGRLPERTSPYF